MTNMLEVWKRHIDATDKEILDTDLCKDGRIKQLCKRKYNLERAYLNVLEAKR